MREPALTVVLPDLGGGGAQRVMVNLVNGLASRGRAVELLVFDARGPIAGQLRTDVSLRNLGYDRLRTALPSMLGELRGRHPRVVLSSLGYVNLALVAMKPLLSRNTKIWLREANLPSLSLPGNRIPIVMRASYRALYPRADRVLCTSQRMREELSRDFSVPKELLFDLFNPVDAEALRVQAVPPLRSPGAGPRFVAAGRMTPQKGFDRLLPMFAALENPESRLSILGTGPEQEGLYALAERLGLAARLEFPGFVDPPWAWFAGADAFLLPSRWEGMPNVALEALACGTPVIATPESGGIAEVAALAVPGAVTVAAAGSEFCSAMRAVVQTSGAGLRPSLLPSAFAPKAALDQICAWLDDDA